MHCQRSETNQKGIQKHSKTSLWRPWFGGVDTWPAAVVPHWFQWTELRSVTDVFRNEQRTHELSCVGTVFYVICWYKGCENLSRNIGRVTSLNILVSVPILLSLLKQSVLDTVMVAPMQSASDLVKSEVWRFTANVFATTVLRFGDGIVSSS